MRSIPTITRWLLGINILAFLTAKFAFGGGLMLNYLFGLYYISDPNFHFFQLVTYMFMHGGWDHLFFNMFALWMFGCVVEKAWGARRFFVYYMTCGVGAGLIQILAQTLAGGGGLTVGASGAIYGILLAFGMTWPEQRIFIFPIPVPIKAKWFVCIYAVIEFVSALATSGDGVAHVAHLGGMLFGYMLIRHWQGGGKFGMRFDMNRLKPKKKEEKTKENPDWRYNEKQQTREEVIDRILDKVRRNGYESLTKEEKQTLFEK
ncbi:MAG: rhomboid family intramembrane serine protease [Bacteroidaceae bacterium]|nr:rhomboid family intramembrane serine protease [Bacteroidaceae bacterium]